MKQKVLILIELDAPTYPDAVKQVEAWVSVVNVIPAGTETISIPSEFEYRFDQDEVPNGS